MVAATRFPGETKIAPRRIEHALQQHLRAARTPGGSVRYPPEEGLSRSLQSCLRGVSPRREPGLRRGAHRGQEGGSEGEGREAALKRGRWWLLPWERWRPAGRLCAGLGFGEGSAEDPDLDGKPQVGPDPVGGERGKIQRAGQRQTGPIAQGKPRLSGGGTEMGRRFGKDCGKGQDF